MALINQNSVIGVTSITSPGASNVLTVHTNDTTERLRVTTDGLSFSGTNASLDTSGNASFNGNVSIGGTLTYEDVTNIDSIGIITARSHVSIADKIIHTGDTDTALRFPAANTFTVETGGSEAIRVDSSQRLIVGSIQNVNNDQLQINNAGGSNLGISRFADNAGGPDLFLIKSRDTTPGDHTTVADEDVIGQIRFSADDGTNYVEGCRIFAKVNGTVGTNSIPTDLVFGSGTTGTEKLRITSAGQLLIHHDTNVAPDGYESMLQLADDSYQGSSTVWKRAAGSSAGANPALILQKVRGADIDGQGAVSDSDSIGQIRFYGADGTTAIECGNISATVDNTTSTNNVPGKLVFKTAKLQAGSGSPVNPTQAMTIKANHNVEIHDGNIVFETAGTGIDFSANANAAGMTSELLDDYEEGTFTMTVSCGGNTDTEICRYTKVGRVVYIEGHGNDDTANYFNTNSNGTGTSVTITSTLPFTPAATGAIPITVSRTLKGASGFSYERMYIGWRKDSTTMYLGSYTNSYYPQNNVVTLNNQTNKTLLFSGSYFV